MLNKVMDDIWKAHSKAVKISYKALYMHYDPGCLK